MTSIKTYFDPFVMGSDRKIPNQWIGDETYAEMVEKSIIACADAIVTVRGDDRTVYLPKRSVFPMCGFWCFGGRIFFNDASIEDSVARAVKIETGVALDASRFAYLRTNLYAWGNTAQGNFPGKNLAPLYHVEVSKDELDRMQAGLSPTEYDIDFGIQRFDRERLVVEKVHPAMLDAFDDIFPR